MLIKCQFVIQTDLWRIHSTNKQHIHSCSHPPHFDVHSTLLHVSSASPRPGDTSGCPPQPPKEGSDLPTASPQICRDGASPCPGSITLPASSMGGMLLLPAIRSSPQQPQPLPGGRGGRSVVTLVTVASTFPEVLVPLCFGGSPSWEQ